MPFRDESFDLVISRHSSFSAAEVFRILKPGGFLVTQQVGEYYPELSDHLGASPPNWGPKPGQAPPPNVKDVGFHVLRTLDESPSSVFKDIGAVVYYLRMVPWNITNFSVATHRERLRELHEHIEARGGLRTHYRHIFLEAMKP